MHWKQEQKSGVYIICQQIPEITVVYVGETGNLAYRFNKGYGYISQYRDTQQCARINIKILQRLIVQKNIINRDNYFFNCAVGNFELILKEINSSDKSINESYEILISLKRFIHILENAVVNKDSHKLDDLVKTYLPKYLFLKKDIFKNILKKTNLIKISKINIMLQKTEYLFRKNSELHREILERFLLNLVKIMK